MQINAGEPDALRNMCMCAHTHTHTHKASLYALLTSNTGWLAPATRTCLCVCVHVCLRSVQVVPVLVFMSACMCDMCVCEVLRVTIMSVAEQSDAEVAVMMMTMMCVDKKHDEEEDFIIPRWLTLAG